jgi:type II secretion system protein N
MGSFKTICAYLLYTLVVVALLMYLQFPAPAVKAYLETRISTIDPGLTLTLDTISPTVLPPGLSVTNANVNRNEDLLVRIDRGSISPVLLSLFRKNKEVSFTLDLGGGEIEGQALLDRNGAGDQVQVAVDISQVRLEQIDAVKTNDTFSLAGAGEGQVTYDGRLTGTGKTNGTFTLSDLQITLHQDLFGIDELLLGQAVCTFSGNNRVLRVKSLTFDGPMAEGKITGSIELRKPIENSQLNLTVNAKPRPELIARLQETIPQGFIDTRSLGTRGMNFRISGSVESPDVSLR